MAAATNTLVWTRIDKLMSERRIDLKHFKTLVPRNKNTYTSWFGEPRPGLKLSDLDEIARALETTPASLLSDSEQKADVQQLELPFDLGTAVTMVEIECKGAGIVLRAKRPRLRRKG